MGKRGCLTALAVLLAVAAVLAAGGFVYGVRTHNRIVSLEEGVNGQWALVENQYQRRADLVPNLVNTVKGYAAHESGTLEAVAAARAKATQITVDADGLNEESLLRYQQAQGELSQALGRLLSVAEKYPELKADQHFLELQAQLEGTENRIATERMRYADRVREYNTSIRQFPVNLIASMGGFGRKPQFEAETGAEKAPHVQF